MAGKVSKAPVVALVDHEEKLKALDAALTKIEKDCGKGSIMKLGDAGVNKDIEVVPTGSRRLSERKNYRDLRPGVFR